LGAGAVAHRDDCAVEHADQEVATSGEVGDTNRFWGAQVVVQGSYAHVGSGLAQPQLLQFDDPIVWSPVGIADISSRWVASACGVARARGRHDARVSWFGCRWSIASPDDFAVAGVIGRFQPGAVGDRAGCVVVGVNVGAHVGDSARVEPVDQPDRGFARVPAVLPGSPDYPGDAGSGLSVFASREFGLERSDGPVIACEPHDPVQPPLGRVWTSSDLPAIAGL
jgi:hypothetical protein